MLTKILYEDDWIVVAYKPAGLATQTAKVGQADMVSELKTYIRSHSENPSSNTGISQSQKINAAMRTGKVPYLGVIHRLDQPVEGLLVFAKEKRSAAALTKQLEKGTLNKQYYAVICGQPPGDCGELVDYLYKDANAKAQVVTGEQEQYPEAKLAVLQYRIVRPVNLCGERKTEDLAQTDGIFANLPLFLADIRIDTGRFHQIRAQMAHGGMPLLGDSRYGSEESKDLSGKLGIRSVALCAYCLEFFHPVSGKALSFRIEPGGKVIS